MINSTNTLNIDGTSFNEEEVKRLFKTDNKDTFSRWVVRPIAVLTAVGLVTAGLFASMMIIAISLALVPLVGLSMWAMKKKMERNLAAANPVVDTQTEARVDTADTADTAAPVAS